MRVALPGRMAARPINLSLPHDVALLRAAGRAGYTSVTEWLRLEVLPPLLSGLLPDGQQLMDVNWGPLLTQAAGRAGRRSATEWLRDEVLPPLIEEYLS